MLALEEVSRQVVSKRKAMGLRQAELALASRVSLPTLKALEQGRTTELGFSKVVRILAALGLELELQEGHLGRPTLDDLRNETGDD
jgi:transcriptional regulator with XRE-family HTH domain